MASLTYPDDRGPNDSERDDEVGAVSPILAHPAFPAIVATWFAVLLGLGTLVIPAVLLERLVQASGLAALVPAASPPLGVTARALCAGAAAAVGVLLGLALARRVAGGQRLPAPKAPRPLAILHEIGEPRIEPVDFPEDTAPAFAPERLEDPIDAVSAEPQGNDAPEAASPLPPEALGLEQLVERLGQAIESRRARLGESASAAALDPPRGFSAFEAAAPEEAAQAAAAYFGRPVDLPLDRVPAPMDAFDPWDDDGEAGADASYGSLLSLGNPLAHRDDDPDPACGEDAATETSGNCPSVDTDAALRAALERLQRLSGVA